MIWTYNGEVVPDDEVSENLYGFIYKITYTDGTMYIGKKNFHREVRLKPRKTDRSNAKRIIRKESNWRKYEGSTKLSKGKTIEKKEILRLCDTKSDLTYWENYYLFANNVLFNDKYLNQNISGKFYAGKITGSKEYKKGE